MQHPKAIGDRTTLAVMLGMYDAGIRFALPFGENTRYDLIIEIDNAFARVQCKTGRLRDGAVRFALCSTYGHHPNPKVVRRDYHGDVEYFGVYCPETTGVYLISIEELGNRQAALRVDAPLNGQKRRIRSATDYEIARVSAPDAIPRIAAAAEALYEPSVIPIIA